MHKRIRSGKVQVGEGQLRDKQQRFIWLCLYGFIYSEITVKSDKSWALREQLDLVRNA